MKPTFLQPEARENSSSPSIRYGRDGFTPVSQLDHNEQITVVPSSVRAATRPGIGMFWLREAITCLIAITALICIVAVLHNYAGKPLPNWPHLISLNSLIAVLSAIFKALLLFPVAECLSELKWAWFSTPKPVRDFDDFESASRGPWGSIKLLFRYPLNYVASLGAVITVVALAIDPFTQQIIEYNSCVVVDPRISASVTRTNMYDRYGTRYGAGEYTLDGPLTVALYQGLIAPPANATSTVSFSCATGNCTFPDSAGFTYRSLGVCSSVQDISDTIISNTSETDGYASFNYSLPSGIWTNGYQQILSTVQLNNTFSSAKYNQPIYSFETLVMNWTYSEDKKNVQASSSAFRIAINLCVREYVGVSVTDHQLAETVRVINYLSLPSISSNFSIVGDLPPYPGVDCTQSQSPAGRKTIPSLPTVPGGPLYVNQSASASTNTGVQYFDPLCAYQYSLVAWQALSQVLAGFFGGQHLASPTGPAYTPYGSAWLLNLYNNGSTDKASVTKYMQGFDNAMTAAIRLHAADTQAPVNGTVLAMQTCVGVRWRWIALPAVLLLLTIALLVATAVKSHRQMCSSANGGGCGGGGGRTPWKSSVLPLLWCGLQDKTRVQYGTLDYVDSMKQQSESLRVSLRRISERASDGWEKEENSSSGAGHGRWALKEE